MWWFQVHQLRSKDVSVRRKAAAALAESLPRAAFRALSDAVRDADPVVRATCITALGRYSEDRRIEPLLAALRDDEPEVVKAALGGLRKTLDPRVGSAATRLIRHDDAAVRGLAAQILDQHAWQPRDQEDIAWWHISRGHFSKAAALGAAAIPALERVIEKGPFSVAVAAVQALGESGGAHTLRPLLAALKSQDGIVCVAALEALSRAALPGAAPAVASMLNHREARVRVAAVEAIGVMQLHQAAPQLQAMLGDPSWEVRRSAAEMLGKLRSQDAVETLSAALRDPDEDVQQTAAMALGNIGDRSAIPALVFALASPASGVRRLAAAALARIDENWSSTVEASAAADQVRSSLAGTDADARFFFEQLFGAKIHSARPLTPAAAPAVKPSPAIVSDQRHKLTLNLLLGLLGERDSVLRQAGVEALGRLREPRAESLIARLLADPDDNVSAAAAEALQQMPSA